MVSGRSSPGQGAEAYDARRAFDGFESGASAVAAAIFGIDHGYQGVRGIVTTGVLALVFTAFFFGTGSLWLPIVVHALLDLRVLAMVPNEGIPWSAEAPPGV